jgi:hypothetical protein
MVIRVRRGAEEETERGFHCRGGIRRKSGGRGGGVLSSEESREEGEEESFHQKEVGTISLQRKNH